MSLEALLGAGAYTLLWQVHRLVCTCTVGPQAEGLPGRTRPGPGLGQAWVWAAGVQISRAEAAAVVPPGQGSKCPQVRMPRWCPGQAE